MIRWIKDGSELRLDEKPFILMSHDNFGMVSVPRIEDSSPLQHGTSDRGFKLPPRDIVLYIELFGNSWEHYYQLRDQLVRYFSPSGNPGYLLVEEGGFSRRIYGYPVDGLGFTDSDRTFQRHIVPVIVHCPDPLWVSQENFSLTIQGGGSLHTGAVPTTVPFTVGTSILSAEESVEYNGSFETYPEFVKIIGAVTNPKIINNATGAMIDFTGTTIAAGDSYTIELGYGRNRVFDQAGVNRIDKLVATSDLTGFKLKPNVSNSFTITGTAITGITQIQLFWYERYLGI